MKFWGLAAILFTLCLCGCSSGGGQSSSTQPPAPTPTPSGNGGSEFVYQQGWLGADAGYSVPLSSTQSLWLFGDTFVGPSNATQRSQYTAMPRNSVGILTCTSGTCTPKYYWSSMYAGNKSFFDTGSTDWYWPLDGFISNGVLYVVLEQMHATGSGGAFGFDFSGVTLAGISNYTATPDQWQVTYQPLITGNQVIPGVSVVANQGAGGNPYPADPSGASYAYFFTLVQPGSLQYMALLRLPLSSLASGASLSSGNWQYLSTNTASPWKSWTGTAAPADLKQLITPGVTDLTVRYHASSQQWIAVMQGATISSNAFYSLSPNLTGPWSADKSLYSYPEMQPSNADYTLGVFCYADNEHPEYETTGQLWFTYACNSTTESDVMKNMNLYRPKTVTMNLPTQ